MRFGRFCFILQPRETGKTFFRSVMCVCVCVCGVCVLLGSVGDSRGIEGMARDGLLFSPSLCAVRAALEACVWCACVRACVWVGG